MSKDPQAPPLPAGDPQRSRIASIAARLMAEDGIDSFSTAKRKAALSLGLPENARLPDDTEVEAELRLYQRLFQDEEQTERIAYLRQKALDFMAIVQPFNPYLTGSVLDGTAGRYAEIDLQLFTDSAKDVEIFLLNRQIDYEHSTPRSDRAEAVLTVHDDDQVMLIANSGKIIRMPMDTLRLIGRNTQGVRLINLEEHELVAGLSMLAREEEMDEDESDIVDDTGEDTEA